LPHPDLVLTLCQFVEGLENGEESPGEMHSERSGGMRRTSSLGLASDFQCGEYDNGSLLDGQSRIESARLNQESQGIRYAESSDHEDLVTNGTEASNASHSPYFNHSQVEDAIVPHTNDHRGNRTTELGTDLDSIHTLNPHISTSGLSSPGELVRHVSTTRIPTPTTDGQSLVRHTHQYQSSFDIGAHVTPTSVGISQQQMYMFLKYYIDSISIWVRILQDGFARLSTILADLCL